MDKDQVILNLRRRLWIERVVFASVALAAIIFWTFSYFASTKSLILIDGKPVVCVTSVNDAKFVLEKVKSCAGANPSEIEFQQQVTVARAPRDASPVSRHKALRVVQGMVSPLVPRWAVLADGKPVVAVPDRETAGAVLDKAKIRFGKLVDNLAEEPQFKENVTVEMAAVNPALFRKSADEAVKFIFAPAAPVMRDAIYTVRRGDIAVTIARRHGISLDKLDAMNPGVNLARLQIGDKIRIKAPETLKPKLTVMVRNQMEREETIPAPLQRVSSVKLLAGQQNELSPGRPGKKIVKYAVIYENGRQAGSEVIAEEIVREPVPRRVAVGIKPHRPSRS